jgi:chromosome segregation and condensation protein ScpB
MSDETLLVPPATGPFAVSAYFLRSVMARQGSDETGWSRLAEMAVLSIVASLQGGQTPVTVRTICQAAKLGESMVHGVVQRLTDKGLLVREEGRDLRFGRSRAFYLTLAETPELRQVLGLPPLPAKKLSAKGMRVLAAMAARPVNKTEKSFSSNLKGVASKPKNAQPGASQKKRGRPRKSEQANRTQEN